MSDEKDDIARARERKTHAESTDEEVAHAKRMAELSREVLRIAERILARRTRKDEDD